MKRKDKKKAKKSSAGKYKKHENPLYVKPVHNPFLPSAIAVAVAIIIIYIVYLITINYSTEFGRHQGPASTTISQDEMYTGE